MKHLKHRHSWGRRTAPIATGTTARLSNGPPYTVKIAAVQTYRQALPTGLLARTNREIKESASGESAKWLVIVGWSLRHYLIRIVEGPGNLYGMYDIAPNATRDSGVDFWIFPSIKKVNQPFVARSVIFYDQFGNKHSLKKVRFEYSYGNLQDRFPVSLSDAPSRTLVRSEFDADDLGRHSHSAVAYIQAAYHIPRTITCVGYEGPDGAAR